MESDPIDTVNARKGKTWPELFVSFCLLYFHPYRSPIAGEPTVLGVIQTEVRATTIATTPALVRILILGLNPIVMFTGERIDVGMLKDHASRLNESLVAPVYVNNVSDNESIESDSIDSFKFVHYRSLGRHASLRAPYARR